MPRKKDNVVQCNGQTLKKKRCNLKTANENGYCHNHKDQFKELIPKKKKVKVVKKEPKKVVKEVKKVVKEIKKEKRDTEKPKDCPVCYCSLKEEKKSLECGHWVHMSCIQQSMKPECPICRAPVKVSNSIKEKMNKKTREVRESYNNHAIRLYQENHRSSVNILSEDVNFARLLMRLIQRIDSR